ncbi:hypothetical protein Taro_022600, partial [Colocasia esculenta]|nr:hypothetical protein [Colocasia esculenta]
MSHSERDTAMCHVKGQEATVLGEFSTEPVTSEAHPYSPQARARRRFVYRRPVRSRDVAAEQLTLVESPLFGFSGVSVRPMGWILLPITLGVAPRNVTKMVEFLVIDSMPGYNAILSRGLIGRIKVVPSSLHQKMKFPTLHGIEEVLGSQRESWRCYILSLRVKQLAVDPVALPAPTSEASTSRGMPVEDLLPVR